MRVSDADENRSSLGFLKGLLIRVMSAISGKKLNPEEWLLRGNGNLSEGDLNEALRCYRRSVKSSPDYAIAWKQMGILFGMMGRYSDAISSFDRAIGINPKDAEAWRHKGFALHRLCRHQDALICFERVIVLSPQDAYARYCRELMLEMAKQRFE